MSGIRHALTSIGRGIRNRGGDSLYVRVAFCLITLALIALAGVLIFNRAQPTQHKVRGQAQETRTTTPAERVSFLLQDVQAADSPTARASAYYSLGVAYLDTNKPNQAIKAFQDASKDDGSYMLMSLDGTVDAYNMLGDRSHMITTMQAIIAHLNASGDPSLLGQVSWYQYKLQVLQQGGSL